MSRIHIFSFATLIICVCLVACTKFASSTATMRETTPTPFVIGLASTTSQPDYSAALATPQQAITVGTKLIVADFANQRVLIWNTIPTSAMTAADVVLGASSPSMLPGVISAPTASVFSGPFSVASDGIALFVADSGYNRVLIWNTIPTTSGTAADVVLGQGDFVSGDPNRGLTADSDTLSYPVYVYVSGGALYVADSGNNRVLVWNAVPTITGTPADFALGQGDLQSAGVNRGGALDADTMNGPSSIIVSGGHLYVADTFNCRVLGWTALPSANGTAADFEIGQNDLQSATCDHTSTALGFAWGLASDGTNLLVTEEDNARALIFNPLPTADQPTAAHVLGQTNMTNHSSNAGGNVAATSLYGPACANFIGGKLWLADSANNRVLVWNSFPAVDDTPADSVVGQVDLDRNVSSQPLVGVTAYSLTYPSSVRGDSTHLYIADTDANRVLIYNTLPTSDYPSASVALGQVDMTSGAANSGGISASTLYGPRDVFSDGTKLYVADSGNNRVLIWNTIPTADGTAADVAVGQANKVTHATGLTATTLNDPKSAIVVGTKLIVADSGNQRVLIWNTIPTSDGAAADVVLGAADKTSAPAGDHTKEFTPEGIWSDGTQLFVSDSSHYRILVWNTIPTSDYTAANFALGQPDTTTIAYPGTATLVHYSGPTAFATYGTKFYASDTGYNRVLEWDSLTGASGQAADHFVGQTTNTGTSDRGFVIDGLFNPRGLYVTDTWAAIADPGHRRVLFTLTSGLN